MDVDKEIQDRIVAAANALYEQNGRTAFPKVDAVRKAARTNMNDVSEVMKRWRASQMAKPEVVVVVQVPQAIADASHAALTMLWQSAQELSNNALTAAQKGWEADRVAADLLSTEMATAFDVNVAELEAAQAEIKEFKSREAQALMVQSELQKDMDGLRLEMAAATVTAEQRALQVREQHASEIAQLNQSFETEHDRRLEEVQLLRDELNEEKQKFGAERDQLRVEITQAQALAAAAKQQQTLQRESDDERIASAETLQNEAQKTASVAREEAAELRGKVDAMQTQMADLLKIIALGQLPPSPKSSPGDLPAIAEISSILEEKQ